MFKHYIFTRFNIGIYDKPHAEEWMEHRTRLFEQFTLPSMQRQTCKDFVWLLWFDERTPESVINRYDYCDNVRVIFESPVEWVKYNHPRSYWLITSRLDNDDYVEKDWVANIQAAFNSDTEVIDFHGRTLDFATGAYFSSGRVKPNSMFLSLIEPGTYEIRTCWHYEHTAMPKHYPSRLLPKLGWTMVVHDRNLMNKVSDSPFVTMKTPQTLYANG